MNKKFMKSQPWLLVAVLMLSFFPYFNVEVKASNASRTVYFPEQLNQNQNQTITIPDLVRVTSISVNTGTASFTQNGNQVTIFTNGGNWTSRESYYDPYYYSRYQTASRGSSSNSFSDTYAYNSGGYSGTLYKNGSSTMSGSYTPSDSKYISGSLSDGDTCPIAQSCKSKEESGMYSSWWYTGGGYSGTVYETSYTYWQDPPQGTSPPGVTYYTWTRGYTYGGTVTKPASDTRYYTQNYTGTVYQGGTNYRNYRYAYNVILNYEYNVAPTASITDLDEVKIGGNEVFTLNTDDVDTSDTINYSMKAGASIGDTKYNAGLSSLSGANRGARSLTFNAQLVPYADLTLNSLTGRYEAVVHLEATASDNMNYNATTRNSFVVYNNRPVVSNPLPDTSNYRVYSNTYDGNAYFADEDGHTLSFTASSADPSVASVAVTGSSIQVQPLKPGTTVVTVTADDGYGLSVSQSFTYTTLNEAPEISDFTLDKMLVPAGSEFTFSGNVSDLESDSVVISATLDGVTETTTVPNGNGTWAITFQTDDISEGKYTSITFNANDTYDNVNAIFDFALDIDKTAPFVWALSQNPTKPTNSNVTLQVNVGDAYSGVKHIEMPDGSIVSKVNSTYIASANGDYTFKVVDNAGNEYTHIYPVENFDNTSATFDGLTLTEKIDGTYKVTVRAFDESGINTVALDSGEILNLSSDKQYYVIDDVPTKPTAISITDLAGNISTPEPFLSLPVLEFGSDYAANKTMKEDVSVTLTGTDELSYKLGLRSYSCSEDPCAFKVTKNNEITAINSTDTKASIKITQMDNIDKTPIGLVLSAERDSFDETRVNLDWNLTLDNPLLTCTSSLGSDSWSPTANNYSFTGENIAYECLLKGEYEGNEATSNTVSVYPDYLKDITLPSPVDALGRKTFEHTVFIEKDTLGESYFLNINKNNTDDKSVPVPTSLSN